MADIGVFHAGLMAGGGAEAVAANTLQALHDAGHELTVYTADDPNFVALDETFGTDLSTAVTTGSESPIDVKQPASTARLTVDRLTDAARTVTGVTDLPLLRRAVMERRVVRQQDSHDLLVSTDGQLAACGPALEYVHFPYFEPAAMRRYGTRFEESLYPQYHWLCRMLRPDETGAPTGSDSTITVTNSRWTAAVLAETTRKSANVVAPPVGVADFDPPEWGSQADGIVCLGRIHPLKRQHVAIEVVDGLREAGIDTHLHLIGPSGSDEYVDRIERLAAERSYVHLEGRVSRDRLVELIETHRYGVHARRFEHFGIAVAELVAGGTIPFVHDSGGQIEIVEDRDELTYTSPSEAIRKMKRIRSSNEHQQSLQSELVASASHYSRERFRSEITSLVEAAITNARDGTI
ncbi:glycosyltransferase [Halosimplex pelagicum]|uniref:Glycosyltransferase n=1 Tax=Halosimplex pelagicum TaxID=869886 RepID=A0A7D5TG75_9EURY|nr:glycosyltransferase [Halosimplex pelagicum]QLH81256.1 glycosyltransferase [Halosimplex pelagicum]